MAWLKFEHKTEGVASHRAFFGRVAGNAVSVVVILALSLAMGTFGYHELEHFSIIDSFANAAMILSGMGPLSPLSTDAGKIFASFYAIYSGVLFVFTTTLLLAPVAHRLLHHFHVMDEG